MERDFVYCRDARHMDEVEDGSVQLIVTSPPYNVGKSYESPLALEEYLGFLKEVWQECVRVLCLGGRLAINVAATWRRPYIPLHAYIATQLIEELGLYMRGDIIWDKGPSVGVSTAWGSFAMASNPTLRDVHEFILVFSKDTPRLVSQGRESGIRNDEFVEWTKSVWHFATASPKRVGHPAPFPEELPRRLILLYTNIGDLVLDPFMGSGSTAVAAVKEGRHFIGYDVVEDYCAMARERVEEARALLDAQSEFVEDPQSGGEPQPPLAPPETRERQGRLRRKREA